jgi:hypothetical protein
VGFCGAGDGAPGVGTAGVGTGVGGVGGGAGVGAGGVALPQWLKKASPTTDSPPKGLNKLEDQASFVAGVTPDRAKLGKENSENQLTRCTNPYRLRLLSPSDGFMRSSANAATACPSLLPIATSVSQSVFFLRPLVPSKSSAKMSR